MLNCAICGTTSSEGTATCPGCGEASWVNAPAAAASPPSEVAAPTEPEGAPATSSTRRSQKPASS